MKAIVQEKYGLPHDVLGLQEIDKPTVRDDEVLVRVRAASIHIGDYYIMTGVPYILRPAYGLRRPKAPVPGTDVAGRVEEVGKDVTLLRPGDEVFGWCTGGFAEYASISEDTLVPKPANLTFEQAAAVGTSACAALQGLRDHGKVQPGEKVMIIGASGGIGTFAVQIAKALGADVTGVCSTRNVDMVRSIGADEIVDYTREDFAQGERHYDLIFDNVGSRSMSDTRRALAPNGTLLSNGAPVGGWVGGIGHVLKGFAISLFVSGQGRPFLSMPNKGDLAALKELAEAEKVTPVIDKTFPLSKAPDAMAHVAERHTRGTTVLAI